MVKEKKLVVEATENGNEITYANMSVEETLFLIDTLVRQIGNIVGVSTLEVWDDIYPGNHNVVEDAITGNIYYKNEDE